MNFSKKLSIILLLIFSFQKSTAQGIFGKQKGVNQYSSISIGGGTSNYFGDLSPYGSFYYGLITNVRWNATLNYTKYVTPNVGIKFGFTWARIAGDDYTYAQHDLIKYANNYLRNFHFRNDIKEFTVQGIYNFIPNARGPQGRKFLTPYAFLGLGFYAHNPQARLPYDTLSGGGGAMVRGDWVSLKNYSTAGQSNGSNYPKPYSLIQIVVPVGFGARIRLNDNFDIAAEIGYRFTPTDYLDDIGYDKYPNPADLLSDDSRSLSNRLSENIAAQTGENRLNTFQQILANKGFADPNLLPISFKGNEFIGYDNSNYRGSSTRWDSYLLTQFTIHYIISNEIKCPVPR